MKKLLIIALAAAPLLASAAPSLGPNLIKNGSFEANAVASGKWSTFSAIDGWTVGANQIELRNNAVGVASDGKVFAELDVVGNSSISQVIATEIGQWYQLSFDYANRADATNGLGWSFSHAAGATIVEAPSLSKAGWTTFTTQVQASGNQMTLSFAALGKSDSLGTSLDNVQVSAVPEPTSLALMGLGLAALGLVSRRKKQG